MFEIIIINYYNYFNLCWAHELLNLQGLTARQPIWFLEIGTLDYFQSVGG